MAHVPEVAQFAELLDRVGNAPAQQESAEARQRVDIGGRENQPPVGSQHAMQLAQRERGIDPQMLERLAEECAAERSVAKRQRRALNVAATHIESEIPHEVGNTPGVEIDANHRIADSVSNAVM